MQSLTNWLLRRIFKYSAPLLWIFESRLLKKYGIEGEYSPIFILGLPRSGSTFLYQILTNIFDVQYIDNLMNFGRESLLTTSLLSYWRFGDKPHNSYSSSYGDTVKTGLHSPSEAGSLWYRWIPSSAIYTDENTLIPEKEESLKKNILALMNRYKKPVIIKNLNFSTRIKLLNKIFPDAKYIYIRRDPLYLAQSIYLGRIKNTNNPVLEWWTVKFPGYEELLGQPLERQVAKQVFELDQIIKNDLAHIKAVNIREVWYEEMIPKNIESMFSTFLGVPRRAGYKIRNDIYVPGNSKKLDDKTLKRLKLELDRLLNNQTNKPNE